MCNNNILLCFLSDLLKYALLVILVIFVLFGLLSVVGWVVETLCNHISFGLLIAVLLAICAVALFRGK